MPPMEPIPETVEAVISLEAFDDSGRLLEELTRLANETQAIVPDLVGVSIGRLQEGLTFTLVAPAEEVAVLDAVQYLAGGPCVDSALEEETHEFVGGDVLDERRWQLFAEASAARTVRSTLSLPVMAEGGAVVGTVNLYAAARRAFAGHHVELAGLFGGWAAGAVANADLSFSTRREAEQAPERLRDQGFVDLAIGLLAAQLDVHPDAAEERLRDAAARAGVSIAALAREIVGERDER